jgi:hypothetical protein
VLWYTEAVESTRGNGKVTSERARVTKGMRTDILMRASGRMESRRESVYIGGGMESITRDSGQGVSKKDKVTGRGRMAIILDSGEKGGCMVRGTESGLMGHGIPVNG